VSLAHLVMQVDVQPNHLGSSPQGREFGFLLFKNKITIGASPNEFVFKKEHIRIVATHGHSTSMYQSRAEA
jgi:hypothetical protein